MEDIPRTQTSLTRSLCEGLKTCAHMNDNFPLIKFSYHKNAHPLAVSVCEYSGSCILKSFV